MPEAVSWPLLIFSPGMKVVQQEDGSSPLSAPDTVVIIQFGGCSQALPLLRPLACQVNDSRKLLLVTYQEQRLSS